MFTHVIDIDLLVRHLLNFWRFSELLDLAGAALSVISLRYLSWGRISHIFRKNISWELRSVAWYSAIWISGGVVPGTLQKDACIIPRIRS